MKYYLILLALLYCSTISRAQSPFKDYLIKADGDTLKANIKYNMMGKIVYKQSKDSSWHIIDTASFTSYYWSKKAPFFFLAVVLPDIKKKTFVGVLETGKLSLYERKLYGVRSSTSYWYACKNGQILEIDNQKSLFGVDSKLKQNFEMLIADNTQLASEFHTYKKYNLRIIRAIVRKYNAANNTQ